MIKEKEDATQALKASITNLEKDVIASTTDTEILKKMTTESHQMVAKLTQDVSRFHESSQVLLETLAQIHQAPPLTETTPKLQQGV